MLLPDVEVNAALDSRFHSGPTRYVLLSSTQPVVGTSGYSGITEPAGYARVVVSPASWSSAAGRATEVTVDLPDVTADLGVFPYWGLSSASSGGTVTVAGEFDEPLVLVDGTNNVSVTLRVESPSFLA